MMVAIKALQSFATYVGANCVTAHEGSVVYVPKQKADELVAGGLAVLVEDAPPAPPETKVATYTAPEVDPAKTHEEPEAEDAEEAETPAPEEGPETEHADESETPAEPAEAPSPVKRTRKRAAANRQPEGDSDA